MGGQISLESSPGAGSTFSFKIPMGQIKEPVNNHIEPDTAVGKRLDDGLRFRLLVVEDNETNRFFLKEALMEMGFSSFVIVNNGEQALDKYKNSDYDLKHRV